MFRLGAIVLLTFCVHPLFGGVVMYRSVGGGARVPLAGPNFMIPANFGKQVGGNLFESFSQFNLNRFQTATFTGPSNVQNILARVTSGSPSSIDGKITIDQMMGDANLFFMNPAGVMFGKNAQLDVRGSFAVSTANYLKLADGGKFNTSLGGGDVLTSAPVSAFGFLNSTPAGVSITGSTLDVASQKSFSAVAGDITMNGGRISGAEARVNLVSVKSGGEAKLDATALATDLNSAVDVTQFTALGKIDITNSAVINTSGNPRLGLELGGPVFIRAGTFLLDDQSLISSRSFDGSLNKDGSVNSLNQLSNIDVRARDVRILAGSRISAPTSLSADAGRITVIATDSLLIDGQATGFTTGLLALGDKESSTGNGGDITVNAGNVEIMNGGSIAAYSAGLGNGGTVKVTADDLLVIDGKGLIGPGFGAGIFADAKRESGGDITVTAGDVKIINGGEISSGVFGKGSGGTIKVTATHSLLIDGTGTKDDLVPPEKGKPPNPISGNTAVFHGTGILALGYGSGNGGSIDVKAPALSIKGGGQLAAGAFRKGDGGKIKLIADSLLIDGTGAVGNVLFGTGIFTANSGSGDGGRVTINTTGPVTVKDGSSISSSSAVRNAGDIKLTSGGEIKLKDQSSITASAGVNGGNITITAPKQLVYLLDSSITATAGNTGSSGIGGNITIDHPQFIVASNSLISANATVGTAGNVSLNSDFLFSSNSTIFATGTINITAPTLDLGAQLITLPSSLLSAANQLQERCTALLQEDFSSFISIGRGGTEPAPEELQEEF
jgi:filamentous hemagglutinin family protein